MAVAIMTVATGCDMLSKKSDSSKDAESTGEEQTQENVGNKADEEPEQPETPVPDNKKAEQIIAKFNQGPAVNNNDYADALDYEEIYLSLTEGFRNDLIIAHEKDDMEAVTRLEAALADIDAKYPYAAELLQILFQASSLEKTEGGLVAMNDDIRDRFNEVCGE